MKMKIKPERIFRSVFLHAVLITGSILFALPFFWLGSTSCKVADEMYPPRWIPQIPDCVVQSPYIKLRPTESPERPAAVNKENWERLSTPIMKAITAYLVANELQFPDFYRPYLNEPDMAAGIFARILKRAPDELFEKDETTATAWFVQNTDIPIASEVFDAVYRRMALSDVVFHGWDVRVEPATMENKFPWKTEQGNVDLITRTQGLRRPAQEVRYSFKNKDSFSLSTILPLKMPLENLKKIVVSINADRSWHALDLTVEVNGKRFHSTQHGFLGSDRWQDFTWQFKSDDDHSIKMKTWLRLEEAGVSSFNDPGMIKLSLACHQAKGFMAAYNKYINNYREVLRIVPLWAYVKNSLILVILNIIGQILGSSLVAYSFARLQWPAREFCFVLVLATLMIPAQVTMIPVFLIFKYLGWYNTLQPLWVGSFFGSAFYIFLLRQFMRGIPVDLEDSAKIDGCSYLGIYWRIILPLIKPAMAAIGIFTFLGTWNDFMGPLIYLNDQTKYPLSLGLFALQVFKSGDYGLMMAASVLMTVPVIALFFAAQRHFIQGVTLTGMKG